MALLILSDVKVFTFIDTTLPRSIRFDESNEYPNVDIIVKEDKIYLYAELPGIKMDEISVLVYCGHIVVEVEKTKEDYYLHRSFIRSERHFGSFRRIFKIPYKVGVIDLSLSVGVLRLDLNIEQDK